MISVYSANVHYVSNLSSSETQCFNEGDGQESGSEKNEEKELPCPSPSFSSFSSLPDSFPSPSPLKPWVSEDGNL